MTELITIRQLIGNARLLNQGKPKPVNLRFDTFAFGPVTDTVYHSMWHESKEPFTFTDTELIDGLGFKYDKPIMIVQPSS